MEIIAEHILIPFSTSWGLLLTPQERMMSLCALDIIQYTSQLDYVLFWQVPLINNSKLAADGHK